MKKNFTKKQKALIFNNLLKELFFTFFSIMLFLDKKVFKNALL